MMKLTQYKFPKTLRWLFNIFWILLLIFTGFRVLTYLLFANESIRIQDLCSIFFLGIRYDLKWIALILLPIVLASLYKNFTPFYSSKTKFFWINYLTITLFLVCFIFIADTVSFSYNRTRLDAGAMNFVEDPGISLKMMWQTYPLIWISIGLIIAWLMFKWMLMKTYKSIDLKTSGNKVLYQQKPFIIVIVLLSMMMYGAFASKPLQWRDAFRFNDSFKSYIALNPLQNLAATLKLRKPSPNEKNAKDNFNLIAQYLGLKDHDVLDYKRNVKPSPHAMATQPNVVLVLCESYSMYKSSMSGNVLNATPYFNKMSKEGIFFDRCFTPHFSTARGLFATITGIPDVQLFKFSSRNPDAINQHTIINDFKGYDKFYFLGGNPEFNNFKGIIENIKDLKEYTELNIPLPKVNVWGVSDKDVFLYANEKFKNNKNPFFAIVQTSSNHRPYMVPPLEKDFIQKQVSIDTLEKYGFESIEEYNVFRYADFSIEQFIESAKKEAYFDNTIFVFIGDHGVAGNATATYPFVWTTQRLTDVHVPFLIYAPKLVKPMLKHEVVSQIDVLPTVTGLIKMDYTNTTLGRDVLDPKLGKNGAFITNTAGKIGFVTNDFYYVKSLEFQEEIMVPIDNKASKDSEKQNKATRDSLKNLTDAIYETAKYMLQNNKP